MDFIDFTAPSHVVAPQLIGCRFFINNIGGVIVEVEAYDQAEPASHTYSGPSARNAAMFGSPGCAYVYRSYGIHWCLNFVCSPVAHGAGVLIRALEPTEGLDVMRERRGGIINERLLCAGPGRVGQALAVGPQLNGASLAVAPFELLPPQRPVELIQGPRIGISKAVDLPWRFGALGSPYLSRPFRH